MYKHLFNNKLTMCICAERWISNGVSGFVILTVLSYRIDPPPVRVYKESTSLLWCLAAWLLCLVSLVHGMVWILLGGPAVFGRQRGCPGLAGHGVLATFVRMTPICPNWRTVKVLAFENWVMGFLSIFLVRGFILTRSSINTGCYVFDIPKL